jgi:hypothetical protein
MAQFTALVPTPLLLQLAASVEHISLVRQRILALETGVPWFRVLDCPCKISNLCSSTQQASFLLAAFLPKVVVAKVES